MSEPYKVGLVGAGGIAPHHLGALRGLPRVEVVGVTDLDAARAAAFAEPAGLRVHASLRALRDAGADVIHVLTPPASHAAVAIEAMELGCHLLVEKPLATRAEDCLRIQEVARRTGRRASVNHSLLYDPQILRGLELVRSGKLGRVVSVDILRGSAYPPYPGGPLPPQYRNAGYPFEDLGVHALYLFQAFLGPIEGVDARWRSLGGDPNLAFDEWRALVRCREGLGQFQLSWNVKPMQSQVIVQGTRGVLRLDLFLMFQALRAAMPLPTPAVRVVNALTDSLRPLVDVPVGVVKFATGRVKPYQGLRNLVAAFYEGLDGGKPLPVELEAATEVVRWVEQVSGASEVDHAARVAALPPLEGADVLVTGASGGLGGAVLRRLAADRKVRVFVRRPPADLPPGVEVALGDLGDPDAVERAVKGVRTVVHGGAAMKGGWIEASCATVGGTRNVVESCRRNGVQKLVHLSSMSVVDWAGNDGGELSEESALEPRPEERGAYTRSKLEAENIVRAAAAREALPAVVLRPGQIFGPHNPLVTGAVARRAGSRWVVLGDGKLRLPLVYVDDVVDAVVAALDGPLRGGEVIQLIDPTALTQNDVIARALPPGAKVTRLPRFVVFALGGLSEILLAPLKRPSPLARYRLRSALSRLRFAPGRAGELLGWEPRVGVEEGIRRLAGDGAGGIGASAR